MTKWKVKEIARARQNGGPA